MKERKNGNHYEEKVHEENVREKTEKNSCGQWSIEMESSLVDRKNEMIQKELKESLLFLYEGKWIGYG